MPLIEVPPELILFGVLPPLLYGAAVNVPLIDFRRNFRPVVGLSVLLVILSALVIGTLIHLFVPGIPLAVGIALGAVVSPTDAVAATSIGKKLGMPARLVSILEGESLVNDATSLVLLKTALAALVGSFAFWSAAGTFAYAVVDALIIGLVMGVITVWIRSKLLNPVYDTAISFIVPFATYMPAEAIGASGVLAVVVTGLYTGHHAAKRFSAQARQNERLNWHTLLFLVENGVFLLMGIQLHALVEDVGGSSFRLGHVGLIALGLTLALIVCRAVFVAPLLWSMRGAARRYRLRSAGLSRRADRARAADADTSRMRSYELLQQRSQADLAHEQAQQLGWRDGIVLSWSGMRGVVTLAAAQSLPTAVPYRSQLILVAFLIALLTLLLHGLSLPSLIRRLWPQGSGHSPAREYSALRDDLVDRGLAALEEQLEAARAELAEAPTTATAQLPPPEIIDRVQNAAHEAIRPAGLALPGAAHAATDASETPAQSYLRLTRAVLEAQRAGLLEERAIGRYSSTVLRAAEQSLDQFESRLMPPPGR